MAKCTHCGKEMPQPLGEVVPCNACEDAAYDLVATLWGFKR